VKLFHVLVVTELPNALITTDNTGSVDDVDEFECHTFRYNRKGFVTKTNYLHNPIRDMWCRMLKNPGYTTSLQPYGVQQNTTPTTAPQYHHIDTKKESRRKD
jgi:hypothetical protein